MLSISCHLGRVIFIGDVAAIRNNGADPQKNKGKSVTLLTVAPAKLDHEGNAKILDQVTLADGISVHQLYLPPHGGFRLGLDMERHMDIYGLNGKFDFQDDGCHDVRILREKYAQGPMAQRFLQIFKTLPALQPSKTATFAR